jgi:hypothetical protein
MHAITRARPPALALPAIYAVCSLPADCNHVLRKATPLLEAHARRAPRTYDPQYQMYQVRARPGLLHRVPSSLRSRHRCSTRALGTSPSPLRHAPRPLYLSHYRRPYSRLPRKTARSIPALCGARGTRFSSLMSLPFLPRARRPLRAKDRLRSMTSGLDRITSAIVLHTTRGNRFPHSCGSSGRSEHPGLHPALTRMPQTRNTRSTSAAVTPDPPHRTTGPRGRRGLQIPLMLPAMKRSR